MCLVGAYNFCCEAEKQKAIREGKNEFSCCGNKFNLGADGACKKVNANLGWVRKNWRKCTALNVSHRGIVTPKNRQGYGGQY